MTKRLGLPAWVYTSDRFFEREIEHVFMRSWQIVCHVNDIPKKGDYRTFEMAGESAIVIRGGDGEVRGFYNVCRHRASRLLNDEGGHCPRGQIRCPYHAWTYDLEGALVALPDADAYGGMDRADWGLKPVGVEIWMGFVFICFEPELAPNSVAQMMAPHADELAAYRFEEMQALRPVTLRPRDVNWKTITDNYIDALHINVAHTGLRRLAGRSYAIEAGAKVNRMHATLKPHDRALWSERLYLEWLPEQAHLPAERQTLWDYYMLWPNVAFDIYPDQMDFMQMLPISPGKTLIREQSYALPGASRKMRAARYLNWRINRIVNAEDTTLIAGVQAGMASRSFVQGPLSDSEVCLTAFAENLRGALPECREAIEPGSK